MVVKSATAGDWQRPINEAELPKLINFLRLKDERLLIFLF
jgi:hypothetical protein